MEIKSFFHNITKIASASPQNTHLLELSGKELKEFTAFLDKENISYTAVNAQEVNFKHLNQDFHVIENDKNEDVGFDGKVIEPAKYEKANLTEEEKKTIAANTDIGIKATNLENTTDPSTAKIWEDHVEVTKLESLDKNEKKKQTEKPEKK